MEFCTRDELLKFERSVQRQFLKKPQPKSVLYYQSAPRDYGAAARAFVSALGKFDQATLLFSWALGMPNESDTYPSPEDKRWRGYTRWRASLGETRPIHVAPGHRSSSADAGELTAAICFCLELGWDARLTAQPRRQLVLFSHDDRVEVYRATELRTLEAELVKLGYWEVH